MTLTLPTNGFKLLIKYKREGNNLSLVLLVLNWFKRDNETQKIYKKLTLQKS